MPDSSSSRGELIAPALTMTSASAYAVRGLPPCRYSSPTARPSRTSTFVALARVRTVRLGRLRTGRRNAVDALSRRARRWVTWWKNTPSCRAPFGSAVYGIPASCAARTNALDIGLVCTWSATFSGPPTPWYSSLSRSLFSWSLNSGSRSSYPQPGLPASRQPS